MKNQILLSQPRKRKRPKILIALFFILLFSYISFHQNLQSSLTRWRSNQVLLEKLLTGKWGGFQETIQEFKELPPPEKKKIIGYLIQALQDPDPNRRYYASVSLHFMPEETREAIPHLIQTLQDPNSQVVSATLYTLGDYRLCDPETVALFLKASRSLEGPIREGAIYALGYTQDKTVIPVLKNALKDSVEVVRQNAVCALGEFPETVLDIVPMLKDPDDAVCISTTLVLKRIKREEAIMPLFDTFKKHSDPVIRSYSLEALKGIGSQKAIPVLFEILRDPAEAKYHIQVAFILSALGDHSLETLHLFTEYFLKEPSPQGRRQALIHLNTVIPKEKEEFEWLLSTLINALKDKDQMVYLLAAEFLGQYKSKASRAVPTLIESFNYSDYTMKKKVIWALEEIASKEAKEAIKRLKK